MYNTILVLNSHTQSAVKDYILENKQDTILVVECDFKNSSYSNVQELLYNTYSEHELLGNDLELENICFFNDVVRNNNIYHGFLELEDDAILIDVETHDPQLISNTSYVNFLMHCKNTFMLQNIIIYDVNQLTCQEEWTNLINKINENNDFGDVQLKTMNDSDVNVFKNLNDLKNMLNSTLQITCDKVDLKTHSCDGTMLNIMFIPLVQTTLTSNLIEKINSNKSTCFVFIDDNDTIHTLDIRTKALIPKYIGNTSLETISSNISIYLQPYWNNEDNIGTISLSKNIEIANLGGSQDNITTFQDLLVFISSLISVSEIKFEIFNINQNYSQLVDSLYLQSSISVSQGEKNIVFSFSSYTKFLYEQQTYGIGGDRYEIINEIQYTDGSKNYLYNIEEHPIEKYLKINKDNDEKLSDYVENTKLNNIVLYDDFFLTYMPVIYESLTPNTIMVPFTISMSYQQLKDILINLKEEPNVEFTNISFFQDFAENDLYYTFLEEKDLPVYDIETVDPSLNEWSEVIDFYKFIVDDLSINTIDLLFCKIFSNDNWKYIMNKIESQIPTLTIRSSDDNTGHVMFDGDWVLESETENVNLVKKYFNEQIFDVEIVLGSQSGKSKLTVVSKDQQSIYNSGWGTNPTNDSFSFSNNAYTYWRQLKLYGNTTKTGFNVLDSDEKIIQIVSHRTFWMILTNKNNIYTFGKNDNNLIGNGHFHDYKYTAATPVKPVFSFDRNILKYNKVRQIEMGGGGKVCYVLFYDGRIFASGNGTTNTYGLTGTNTLTKSYVEITYTKKLTYDLPGSPEFPIRIAGGNNSIMILTNKRNIYAIGRGAYFQTGIGSSADVKDPTLVTFKDELYENEYVTQIFGFTSFNTVLQTNQGNIYSCGRGGYHMNGNGQLDNQPGFVRAIFPTGFAGVKKVFTLDKTVIVRSTDDKYYSAGYSQYYRHLGGAQNRQYTEIAVNLYSTCNNSHVKEIVNTDGTNAIITENNEVFAWGLQNFIMGTNTTDNATIQTPKQVYTSSTSDSSNYLTDASFGEHIASMSSDEDLDTLNGFGSKYVVKYSVQFKTDISNNSEFLMLSEDSQYDKSKNLTFMKGVYEITDIPEDKPLALLNNGVSNIVYDGLNVSGTSSGPDGNSYTFYYGKLFIYVEGSFSGTLSFYSTYGGGTYFGTQNKVKYESDILSEYSSKRKIENHFINDLNEITYLDVGYIDSSTCFVLNTSDDNYIYTTTQYNIVTPGIYKIISKYARYMFTITTDNTDNNVITPDTTNSESVDGTDYYKEVSFRIITDISMTLNISILDKETSNVTEITDFITYNINTISGKDLQYEYIATSDYASSSGWDPIYAIGDAHNETSFDSGGVTYGNDTSIATNAGYFERTSANNMMVVPPYKNRDYIFNVDVEGVGRGYTFEAWIKYVGNGSRLDRWPTLFGPATDFAAGMLRLRFDGKSMGLEPNQNSFTYTQYGSDPGDITDYQDELIHIVADYRYNYVKDPTYGVLERRIFINGVEYQMTDSTGASADRGYFDVTRAFNSEYGINQPGARQNIRDTYIYSFRLWHRTLSNDEINELHSQNIHYSIIKQHDFISDSSIITSIPMKTDRPLVKLPHELLMSRMQTYASTSVFDLSPNFGSDGHTYTQSTISYMHNQFTYTFNLPENVTFAFVPSSGVYTDISYVGMSASTGTLSLNDVEYPLYSGKINLKVNSDASDGLYVTLYNSSQENYNTYKYLTYKKDETIEIDSDIVNTIELNTTEVNRLYFVENTFDFSGTDYVDPTNSNKSVGLFVYQTDDSDRSIKDNKLYAGTELHVRSGFKYSLLNVPEWYPIAILHEGNNSYIEITGDDTKKIQQQVGSTTYDFYYGDVFINVYQNFQSVSSTGFTLYSTFNGGSMVGKPDMIKQQIGDDSQNIEPLLPVTFMTVDTDNSRITMNSKSFAKSDQTFGIDVGTYIIRNIPEDYAIAILNNDYTSNITYTGSDLHSSASAPDGNTYDYYYNTVYMYVNSVEDISNETIGLATVSDGYLGSSSMFKVTPHLVEADASMSIDISDLAVEFLTSDEYNNGNWISAYMKDGVQQTIGRGSSQYFGVDKFGTHIYTKNRTHQNTQYKYPDMTYMNSVDTEGVPGITWEVWIYQENFVQTNHTSVILQMDTGSNQGPHLTLNNAQMKGIGMSPRTNDIYSGLENPGLISDYSNIQKLMHIVGYMYRSGNVFKRGIYLNGKHYPSTPTVNINDPRFDSGLWVKVFNTGGYTTAYLRLYSIRMWQKQLSPQLINMLYSAGPNASVSKGIPFRTLDYYTQNISPNVPSLSVNKKFKYIVLNTETNSGNYPRIAEFELYVDNKNVAALTEGAVAQWCNYEDYDERYQVIHYEQRGNDGHTSTAMRFYSNNHTSILIEFPEYIDFAKIQRMIIHMVHNYRTTFEFVKGIHFMDESYNKLISIDTSSISRSFWSNTNYFIGASDYDEADKVMYKHETNNKTTSYLPDASYSYFNIYDPEEKYFLEPLSSSSGVTLITDDASYGNIMVLNSNTDYVHNKFFTVFKDNTYTLTGIDATSAIALIYPSDMSNCISYTGTFAETKSSVYDPDYSYNYYYGDVTITVSDSFNDIVLVEPIDVSLNSSGNTKIIYHNSANTSNNEFASNILSDPDEDLNVVTGSSGSGSTGGSTGGSGGDTINSVCLTTTSVTKVALQTNLTSKYIFNYESGSSYDSTLHYGLNIGNYRITNIPDDYPLAIFNSAVSNEIIYTGTNLVGSKYDVKAGGTYKFYSGTLYITVKSIPTNITALSYGTMNDTTLFEENKLIFDTDCVSDGSYSLCLPSTNTLSISSDSVSINNESFVNGKLAGVHDGYYKFTDISSTYPIAFASDASNSYSYTGISYKSVEYDILMQTTTIDDTGVSTTTTDVSYQNVDFFYGDVELYVKDTFDELSMYVYNDGSFIRQKLNYTDFCTEQGKSETTAKTIQCLKQDSSMNIVYDNGYKVLFNDLTTYDDRVMYGLFYGSYTVRDVPPEYAFRLIEEYDYGVDPSNIDVSNVYLSSDSYIVKNISDPIEDYSGVYYYGDVNIVIKDDLNYLNKDIKIQFVDMSIPDDLFVYTDTCATEDSYYTKCLDISSSLNIVNSNGNKFVFNGETAYEQYLKLGVFIGEYEIHNIPNDHPIAILNHDVSDAITYTGDNLYGVKQVNDVSYNFYTGTVVINVKDNFTGNYGNGNNNLSFYCYNHGYMGSEGILVFTDVCYDPTTKPPYFSECLDISTNIVFDGDNILLNNDTKYNYYKRYGITVGTYNFNDVSENTPITFISSLESNQYDIDGTLYGVKIIDDISYSFYYGDVKLKIYEDFSNNNTTSLSLYEWNSESYYGMENKFVFDNTCGNLGDPDFSYVICLNEETLVNTYLVDSSYFYTFNDSTDYFGYKRFGMHVGNFILKNIPLTSPIAFLNKDISDNIIYSGNSNKKFTKQGPDGHTYDFYYGDVDVQVFGDFGTMSAYSYQGHYAGTEDLFQFTDYCEVNGFVTQCMSLDTSFNKYNNKFTMNNSSSYNEFIRYGLTTGTYTISNIPSDEAIGFITNDISNSVVIYGNSEDLCGNFAGPDGNNYDFYTNKINIIVKDKFDGFLKMYSYADLSYNNGEELLTYSDLCTEINTDQKFIRCLDSEKVLDISSVDGSFVVLDTSYNYNAKRQYGMFKGIYTFNVPETYPIAFFNAGKETKIIYQGSTSKRTLKADPTGTNLYYYYHGTVTVTVMDDFGTLSYHILNNGYMGGENNLVYTDKCELVDVPYVVECVTNTSKINIFDDSGVNKYSLNNNNHSNDFIKFGLHDGNYTITDICDNYPIALLNNGKEEHIHYSGASTDLCGNFTGPDGNSYKFYKNSINITVNSDFTSDISGMSLYVYGDISGYYGLEEKLLYTDICEDTLTTERVVTNTDVTLLKFNKLKYNTYEKAGNNSYFI